MNRKTMIKRHAAKLVALLKREPDMMISDFETARLDLNIAMYRNGIYDDVLDYLELAVKNTRPE